MALDSIPKELADPKLLFVRKLQIAAAVELDYWEDRENPPNLSIHEFKRVLPLMPISLQAIWEPRKSTDGPHGNTGEKQIFKLDFQITILRKNIKFFIKGYFFDEGNCRGVTIQSFRKSTAPRLRAVE